MCLFQVVSRLEVTVAHMQANVAHKTRQLLMEWQAEDGVDAHKTGLQDPPLLALEIEAAGAELTILKQVYADRSATPDAQDEEAGDKLLKACLLTLARFESPQSMMSANSGDKVCVSHALTVLAFSKLTVWLITRKQGFILSV
jgi:hypothetical protein